MLWGLIKPNDWKIVHKAQSEFTYVGIPGKGTAICVLEYSPSRNKYRIREMTGNSVYYKSFSCYIECVNKQIELESKN